ncbi:hypothetical protein, partial [Propionivibrio sp.]|uniref:YncE family protein n=1 Tax=Propionivibrio sp. TaxID=2212460 RepID=UPI002610D19B
LELGDAKTTVPVQLSLTLQDTSGVAEGDEVLFLRRGMAPDINGVMQPKWWVLDNGFVQRDSSGRLVARTASPPYNGVSENGDLLCVKTTVDVNTGAVKVKGYGLPGLAIVSGTLALTLLGAASVPGIFGAAALISLASPWAMALGVLAAGAVAAGIYSIQMDYAGAYQVKPMTRSIEGDNITLTISDSVKTTPVATSDAQISKMEMVDGKLRVTVENLAPTTPDGMPERPVALRFWMSPEGLSIDQDGHASSDQWADDSTTLSKPLVEWTKLVDFQPVNPGQTSITVDLDIPAGVALGLQTLTVQRLVQTLDFDNPGDLHWVADGEPASATVDGQTGYDVVSQGQKLLIFKNNVLVKEVLYADDPSGPVRAAGNFVDQIAFNLDKTLMFVAGGRGDIHIMDTATLRLVQTIYVGTSNISALAVADGWLYVAEVGSISTSSRLLRVNIGAHSVDFLRQQQIMLSYPLYGYIDLAVIQGEGHSYLGITAPASDYDLFSNKTIESGNAYVIDLNALTTSAAGMADATGALTMVPVDFPAGEGQGPQFISGAGIRSNGVLNQLRFLLTDGKDADAGLATVTVNLTPGGSLTGTPAKFKQIRMAGHIDGATRLDANYKLNIQRAQSPVLVVKDGVEYALVADYFFELNAPYDTLYYDYFKSAGQMGGKVGIIKDPFGKAEYLGATTPVINGNFNRLHVSEDSTSLMADLRYWPTIGDAPPDSGLLVWNLSELLSAAELNSIKMQNSKKPNPIDRIAGRQVVTPIKYNLGIPGDLTSGWVSDIESPNDSVFLSSAAKAIVFESSVGPAIIPFVLNEAVSEVILTVSTFQAGDGLFVSDLMDLHSNILPGGTVDWTQNDVVTGVPVKLDRIFTKKLTVADIGSFDAGEKSFQLPNDVYLTAGQHYYWGVEVISAATGQKSRDSGTLDAAPILDTSNTRFAGVTIITHDTTTARLSSPDPVVDLRAQIELGMAIAEPGKGSVFVYDPASATWKWVFGVGGDTTTPADVVGHPLVLIANWMLDSSIPDSGFSEAAADALFAALVRLDGATDQKLFKSPLHFIGLGRGASVNSEVTQRIGKYFPDVKDIQFTTLDPHDFEQFGLSVPVTGLIGDLTFVLARASSALKKLVFFEKLRPWLDAAGSDLIDVIGLGTIPYNNYKDPQITLWSNIGFADNYYQTLGYADSPFFTPALWRTSSTYNGRPILGADVNISLNGRAGFVKDQVIKFLPWINWGNNEVHLQVEGWYLGTVALSKRDYEKVDGTWGVIKRKWEQSWETANPWYRAGQAFTENADIVAADTRPSEGVGTGWGYSYLGGGATTTMRPGGTGHIASVDDHGESTQVGNKKEAVPTVFNGDFQSSRFPVYNRFFSAITGYEIPGWAFQGGSGGWTQGLKNLNFEFDFSSVLEKLPEDERAAATTYLKTVTWKALARNVTGAIQKLGISGTLAHLWQVVKHILDLHKVVTDDIKKLQADGKVILKNFTEAMLRHFGAVAATSFIPALINAFQADFMDFQGSLSAGDTLTHDWQYFPKDKGTLLIDVSAPEELTFDTVYQDLEDLPRHPKYAQNKPPRPVSGTLLVTFKDADGFVLATESVEMPAATGTTRRNVPVTIPTALRGKVGQFSFEVKDVYAKLRRSESAFYPWSVGVDNIRLGDAPAAVPPSIVSLTLEQSSIFEGASAVLHGEFSDITKPEQTHVVIVDWGNDVASSVVLDPGVTTFSIASLYPDDNPSGTPFDDYTVKVWICDSEGGQVNDTLRLTVVNAAPTVGAEFASPSIVENTAAVLQLHINDASLEDSLTVTVNWGDGVINTQTLALNNRNPILKHVYRDDNPSGTPRDDYTVQIRVEDDDLGVGDMTTVITVVNQNPKIQIGGGGEYAMGDIVTPYAFVTDPGPDDVLEYHWQVFDPDGAVITESFTLTAPSVMVTRDDGSYTARLSVKDDDLGEAEASVVFNARTFILYGIETTSPFKSTYREGDTITFEGNVSGVELDNCYIEVNWGDGDIERLSLTDNVTHTRGAFSGTHVIKNGSTSGTPIDSMTISARLMRISDTGDDVQLANWQHTITVENVPPELSNFTATPTATAGEFEFGVSVQDPGVGDTFTYVWNFGNGIIETTT